MNAPRAAAFARDEIALRADFAEIGPAVDRLMEAAAPMLGSEEAASDLRLAVTEALNNIVEHSGHPPHLPVRIQVGPRPDGCWLRIVDRGGPLPTGLIDGTWRAPETVSCGEDADADWLPEGGWGWLLIRGAVDRIVYDRQDGVNRLWLAKSGSAPEPFPSSDHSEGNPEAEAQCQASHA